MLLNKAEMRRDIEKRTNTATKCWNWGILLRGTDFAAFPFATANSAAALSPSLYLRLLVCILRCFDTSRLVGLLQIDRPKSNTEFFNHQIAKLVQLVAGSWIWFSEAQQNKQTILPTEGSHVEIDCMCLYAQFATAKHSDSCLQTAIYQIFTRICQWLISISLIQDTKTLLWIICFV